MTVEERPNPDALLKAIQAGEYKRGKGRLKIFLGMAAGVGKTYTMLEAAQKRMEEGVDVLVGYVETHGRPETARLLEPFKCIPLKDIEYKGIKFKELNLDEIIKAKPHLVLIDELAHTNVPGSKHVKRWQDVVEILEAGIDVFTTVNIQHIESYKDIVEGITSIQIRETVPDYVLEQAAEIELVDIPPAELLQRLKEGKVYTGDLSGIALQNFFQEDRLTALREIALRFTAEMVDLELHELVSTIRRGKVWRPRERILVAVNHYPYMQQLIRSARRFAFTLHAPWTVVYVDDGSNLDDEQSAFLSKNLALARELGAEVVTTQDAEVAVGIQRVAEQKNSTQIIIGKSMRWSFYRLFYPSLADKLSRLCNADVHIMRPTAFIAQKKKKVKKKAVLKGVFPYVHILFWIALLTLFNTWINPYVGYKVVGSVFLLSILVLSLFFKRGPLFLCALVYVLIWDFLFVPQVGALDLSSPEDIGFAILFFLAALITGILTNRVKKRQDLLIKRERSTQAIYEIVREISAAPTSAQLFSGVKEKLGAILQGSCEIIARKIDDGLNFETDSKVAQDEKEKAVAEWVFDHGKEAGWSTSTLSSVKNLFIPLKGFKENVGVLAFRPFGENPLLPEEANFLYTVSQQIAHYLERSFGEEKERQNQLIHQVEQIYGKVLRSISRELYPPLKAIQSALDECKSQRSVIESMRLFSAINKIEKTSEGLMRIAENATAMSKLSGGSITFQKSLQDIGAWIHACCEEIKHSLAQHQLQIKVADDIPPVALDFSLMTILLHHLLSNAVAYSPPGSTIEIEAVILDGTFILSVLDEGKGIPEDVLDLVFEKFYRVQGTVTTGLGLGLAIVKSIAEIHHGWIQVQNRPIRGTRFSLLIPL